MAEHAAKLARCARDHPARRAPARAHLAGTSRLVAGNGAAGAPATETPSLQYATIAPDIDTLVNPGQTAAPPSTPPHGKRQQGGRQWLRAQRHGPCRRPSFHFK